MKVLVCGSRDWKDKEKIRVRLAKLPAGTVILHGACRGADLLAAKVGYELGFVVLSFPADWDKLGKKAGPIRNSRMVDENPDLGIAFHENYHEKTGTADCVRKMKARGIPVEILK